MLGPSAGRRRLRAPLIAAALTASLLFVWALLSAALGAYHATGAKSDVDLLREQVERSDAGAVAQTLESLQRHVASVGRWWGGAPWTWLEWLPVAGDTVEAATSMAKAADAVTAPLLPALAAVVAGTDGSLASAARLLQEHQAGFIAAGAAADVLGPEVAAIDSSALLGPAASEFAAVQQRFAESISGVKGLAAASVLLPGLLGIERPTPWVLVASQPAEARGSGAGLFGAYAIMQGDAGELQMLGAHSNNDVFDVPADLSVLPREFAALWGASAAYIWGHNLTRHFPYAASLLAQTTSTGGTAPAFVVALDPRVLAALLRLAGPVAAAGVAIDADTAEEYLTTGIYRQFPDPEQKDQVVLELMAAVLGRLQQAEASPAQVVAALAEPLNDQHLVAWAADPQTQQVLELSSVAGALPEAPLDLTVAFNNAGGNKSDAFLRTAVDVELQGCGDAIGSVTVQLGISGLPEGLPEYVAGNVRGPEVYGGTREMVHVYGPPGARLLELTIDGLPADVTAGTERGRPVWGTVVDLVPEAPRTISATFAGGLPDDPLGFLPQPMPNRTIVTLREGGRCP